MLAGVTLPKIIFELLIYALAGLCSWHALRQGTLRRARLIELGAGVLYGVTLETLTILQFHAYRYGHFLVMLGAVPLCIGVAWGVILYYGMQLADSLPLPRWAAPALVALLGLNIDLSTDAIAIRIDMWHWAFLRLDQQWFGVPFGNFFAWFVVLCSASALLWLVRPLTARAGWRGPLAALGAIAASVVILALLDELQLRYALSPGALQWLPMTLLLAGGIVVVAAGAWRARAAQRSPSGAQHALADAGPALVPLVFHVFFFTMLFVAGIASQLPALVGVSLAMLLLGLALDAPLALRAWRTRARIVQPAPATVP